MILSEFAGKCNGKARKTALSLAKNVIREPSLEDKIVKVYEGYCDWETLCPCIDPRWFDEKDIRQLANEANRWRNELAHEKRTYIPSEKTVKAVRLIEHLNYSILLRQIGCSDEEIRYFLENMLTR